MPLKFLSRGRAGKKDKKRDRAAKSNDVASALLPSAATAAVPHSPKPSRTSNKLQGALSQAGQVAASPISQSVGENALEHTQRLTPPTSRPSSSGNDLHNTGPLAAGNRRSLTKTNPNYSYVGDVGTSPDGRRDDSRLVMLRDNRDRPRLASPVTSSISVQDSIICEDDGDTPGYARIRKISKEGVPAGETINEDDAHDRSMFAVSDLSSEGSLQPDDVQLPSQDSWDSRERAFSSSLRDSPQRRQHLAFDSPRLQRRRLSLSMDNLPTATKKRPLSTSPRHPGSTTSSGHKIRLGQSLNDVFSSSGDAGLQLQGGNPSTSSHAASGKPTNTNQYHELEVQDADDETSSLSPDQESIAQQNDRRMRECGDYDNPCDAVYNTLARSNMKSKEVLPPEQTDKDYSKLSIKDGVLDHTKPVLVAHTPTSVASARHSKTHGGTGKAAAQIKPCDTSSESIPPDAPQSSRAKRHGKKDSHSDQMDIVLLLAQQQKTAIELQQQQQAQMQFQLQQIQQLQLEQMHQQVINPLSDMSRHKEASPQNHKSDAAPRQSLLSTSNVERTPPRVLQPQGELQVPQTVDDFLTALAQTVAANLQQQQQQQQAAPKLQASPHSHESKVGKPPTPPGSSGQSSVLSSRSFASQPTPRQTFSRTTSGQTTLSSPDYTLPSLSTSPVSPLAQWFPTQSGNHQLDALQEANSLLRAVQTPAEQRPMTPDDVILARRLQALVEHIKAAQDVTTRREESHKQSRQKLKNERRALRKENEQLQLDLQSVAERAAAGQQDAEEILSKQQAIWKRERDALARAHEETQIENDRLQRLLDTHQSLDSTSIMAEKHKNNQLREQLQDYELIVHRQNEHLAYLQGKHKDHRTHEQLAKTSGSLRRSTTKPKSVDTQHLCPLIIAYDKRLEEKDEFIRKQEVSIDHAKQRSAKLSRENSKLLKEVADAKATKIQEAVEELDTLQTQNQLLHVENSNLAEQKEVLSKKMQLVISSAKKQVESEHKELQDLQAAYDKLNADFADLAASHHDIRTAHDALCAKQEDLIPRSELAHTIEKWQLRLKRLEEQHGVAEVGQQKTAEQLRDDKSKLIGKVTELSHQLDVIQKQLDDSGVEKIELADDVGQLQKDLDSAHDLNSQLRGHLSAVTAEAEKLSEECQSLRNMVNKEQMLHDVTAKEYSTNSRKLDTTKQKLASVKMKASQKVNQMSARLEEQRQTHSKELQEVQRQARHLQSLLEDRQKQIHRLTADLEEREEQVQRLVDAAGNQHDYMRQSLVSFSKHVPMKQGKFST